MDASSVTRPHRNPANSPAIRNYLFSKIDQIPSLKSARIVFFDGKKMHELRPHPPICQKNYLSVVLRKVSASEISKLNTKSVEVQKQDSGFWGELLNTSLSCGAAALSWVAVGGSGAAIPFSAGSSSVITVLSYTAATASSIQCLNSGYRLYNETSLGDAERNSKLDSQEWYQHTMTALDAISIAGAAAAAGATLKLTLQLSKSGTPVKEVLKGLSRQQRKSLTEDIIRAQNPGISNKALKALVAAGTYPKRFGKVELSSSVRNQLIDAVGAAFSFSGSAASGTIRKPSNIGDLAIAVFEEFEVY